MSSVVACSGLVLAASSPSGPGPDMLGFMEVSHYECGEESSDLRYRVADHHAVAGAGPPFVARDLATDSQACAVIARGGEPVDQQVQ